MGLTHSVVNSILIGTVILAGILILTSSFKRAKPKKRRELPREPKVGLAKDLSINAMGTDDFFEETAGVKLLSTRSATSGKKASSQVLSLYIMARQPYRFTGYELLQVLHSNGFRFGKMNIFHYHPAKDVSTAPLFSLVSATEPGTFDINNMGAFSCPGLSLFMTLGAHPDPENVLALMIDLAKQLSEELDADLFDSHLTPWDRDVEHAYYEAVETAFA